MFRKLIILLIVWICTATAAFAQTLPGEKIFLAPNRSSYLLGDSILVDGTLIRSDNDSTLSPYSRFLYLELFNDVDSVLVRQKIVVDSIGRFETVIYTVPNWGKGAYYLRAFTKMMENFPPTTFPIVPLNLSGQERKHRAQSEMQCDFYPEGGSLHEAVAQKVGLFLSDEYGQPYSAQSYCVLDEKKDTIATGTTTTSGWDVLRINPERGQNYFLKASVANKTYEFLLPTADNSTPVIQSNIARNRLIYTLLPGNSIAAEDLMLYMYHQATGLQILPLKGTTGMVSLAGVPEGVVSLLLTDKNGKVLSESHQWIRNTQTAAATNLATIHPASLSLQAGKPIDFVADAALENVENSAVTVRFIPSDDVSINYIPTAVQQLIFDEDLSSKATFPSALGKEDARLQTTDAEAWLCSATFKRLDIEETLKNGLQYSHMPETELSVRGVAADKDGNRLRDGSIVAYRNSDGWTTSSLLDHDGKFAMALDDFDESEKFFIEAYTKRNEADVFNYTFANDTIPNVYNWNRVHLTLNDVQSAEDESIFRHTIDLPSAVVMAKAKQDKYVPEKQFYGTRYITEEEMEKRYFADFKQLTEYFWNFMYFMPKDSENNNEGTVIKKEAQADAGSGEWVLVTRRPSTLRGPQEVSIFIDGITQITATEAWSLCMDDIACAEYLSPSECGGRFRFAMNGVLNLITKKYKKQHIPQKGIFYIPPFGLSNLHRSPTPLYNITAPAEAGNYRMLIDVVSPKSGIHSYEYPVEVR